MIKINPKILHQFSENAEMLYENSYSNTIVYGDLVRNLVYLANSRDLPIESN
jgi:hypothetical protein